MDLDIFLPIDIHFALFITRLEPSSTPELLIASALVSRATREGHVCLDLTSSEIKPVYNIIKNSLSLKPVSDWPILLAGNSVVGNPGDYTPLILDGRSRLYLHRLWQYEEILADNLLLRMNKDPESIDPFLLREGLDKFFPKTGDKDNNWQKIAAAGSLMKRFLIISGGPGTGKTTIAAKIIALYMEQYGKQRLRVALAAPTGKAAIRLWDAIKDISEELPLTKQHKEVMNSIRAVTIHRLLGASFNSPRFIHGSENLLSVDMVLIDEASMVDLPLMSKLVQAIPFKAPLILMGDMNQLSSVEPGAVIGDLCSRGQWLGFSAQFASRINEVTDSEIPSGMIRNGPGIQDSIIQLKKNYRFESKSGIFKVSKAINQGHGELALDLLKHKQFSDLCWRSLPTAKDLTWLLKKQLYPQLKQYLNSSNLIESYDRFIRTGLFCALRKGPFGVSSLNQQIEKMLQDTRLINNNTKWYRGKPVMINRNDANLGLYNGDIGLTWPDPAIDQELRVFFPVSGGKFHKLLPIRLPEHQAAYAMTVHKSQGSEFRKVILVLPNRISPVLTRELLYTAITRARQGLEIWGMDEVFLAAVDHRIDRSSGLRDRLWEHF